VPEWYKQDAFVSGRGSTATRPVRGRATQYRQSAQPGRDCSLLIYWTRRADRYNPKLDQSRATTKAMQAQRDSLMNAHLDSLRMRPDSNVQKKPSA
jgi:hypothetical protein